MKKILGLIGLCKKARKLQCGESICKEAVRFGKSYLIIIATDASDNTKKSIINSCTYYGVDYFEFGTKEILANAVGNFINAVISINDEGFAKAISKHISSNISESEW